MKAETDNKQTENRVNCLYGVYNQVVVTLGREDLVLTSEERRSVAEYDFFSKQFLEVDVMKHPILAENLRNLKVEIKDSSEYQMAQAKLRIFMELMKNG